MFNIFPLWFSFVLLQCFATAGKSALLLLLLFESINNWINRSLQLELGMGYISDPHRPTLEKLDEMLIAPTLEVPRETRISICYFLQPCPFLKHHNILTLQMTGSVSTVMSSLVPSVITFLLVVSRYANR